MKRAIFLIISLILTYLFLNVFIFTAEPVVSSELALNSVNSPESGVPLQLAYEATKTLILGVCVPLLFLLLAVLFYWKEVRNLLLTFYSSIKGENQ